MDQYTPDRACHINKRHLKPRILGSIWIILILWTGCTPSSNPSSSIMPDPPDQMLDLASFNAQETTSLVQGQNWQPAQPSLDPFASLIHDRIPCDWTSWGMEYGGVEVNTGRCGYMSLHQPLLDSINTQTWLKISAWHTPLLKGDQEGEAFFSLMIGDQVIWEKTLWIPSEATSWEDLILSPLNAPKGTSVYLNVRNHGANSWVFHSLKAWTP